eukprot:TRINITY_DN12159_c0_g5_i1.p1 TRINITY_DN12159_c0_g5~~TRINITY_DN12159_c0_g5_i1.p1  ORF type:complete len:445 (+),score=87.03 TRINITY_DN12159_c0_g5_i1:293-1627(+)
MRAQNAILATAAFAFGLYTISILTFNDDVAISADEQAAVDSLNKAHRSAAKSRRAIMDQLELQQNAKTAITKTDAPRLTSQLDSRSDEITADSVDGEPDVADEHAPAMADTRDSGTSALTERQPGNEKGVSIDDVEEGYSSYPLPRWRVPMLKTENRPEYCINRPGKTPPYYVTMFLLGHMSSVGRTNLSGTDIAMWMTYYRYAGIDHIYFCDMVGDDPRYSLADYLRPAVRSGFLTYENCHDKQVKWAKAASQRVMGVLHPARQSAFDRYGPEVSWMGIMDMDEYVVVGGDQAPGFIARKIKAMSEKDESIGEFGMSNYFMHGFRNTSAGLSLLRQVTMRTKEIGGGYNGRIKAFAQPKAVQSAAIHGSSLKAGYRQELLKHPEMYQAHFWAARLLGYKNIPLMPKMKQPVVLDETLVEMGKKLEACFAPFDDKTDNVIWKDT